jgi:hypothetical protein
MGDAVVQRVDRQLRGRTGLRLGDHEGIVSEHGQEQDDADHSPSQ